MLLYKVNGNVYYKWQVCYIQQTYGGFDFSKGLLAFAPKFQFTRSVEYKTSGYKLSPDRKTIEFKDGFKASKFELQTSRDLVWYSQKQSIGVRVVDLGLNAFYTVGTLHVTSVDAQAINNPKYLRNSEKRLKKLQRRVSRRHRKGKSQSNNCHKVRIRLETKTSSEGECQKALIYGIFKVNLHKC